MGSRGRADYFRYPIGIWGDGLNNGNGYAYVGNNPWSLVDPFGLQSEDGIAEENARRCKQRVETLGMIDRESTAAAPLADGVSKSAGEAANPRTWAGGAKGFIIDGGVLFVEGTFNLVVHPIRSFNGAQDLATSGWRFSWEDDYRTQKLKELRKTLANSAASPASKRAASATAPVGAITYGVALPLPTRGANALKANVSRAAAGETVAVATEATATATMREAAAVEAASGAGGAGVREAAAVAAESGCPKLPPKIYRGGGKNPGNLKPRPGEKAISFRDSMTNPANSSLAVLKDKWIEVDTSLLPEGSVVMDGGTMVDGSLMPPGHVSVTATAEQIQRAITNSGAFPK